MAVDPYGDLARNYPHLVRKARYYPTKYKCSLCGIDIKTRGFTRKNLLCRHCNGHVNGLKRNKK